MARLPLPPGSTAPAFDPTYLILFDGADRGEPYKHLVALTPEQAKHGTRPHGLDLELLPIFGALTFCLHLPRTLYDTVNVEALTLYQSRDFQHPHHIVPLPTRAIRDPEILAALDNEVTLLLAPDHLADQAEELVKILHVPVGVVRFSEMTLARLADLWKELAGRYATTRNRLDEPPELSQLGSRVSRVSFAHLARQFRTGFRRTSFDVDPFRASLHLHLVLRTTAQLEEQRCSPEEANVRFPTEMDELWPQVRVHATLGCLGVAPPLRRAVFRKREAKGQLAPTAARDSAAERDVLSFLVEHRACATTGVGLCIAPLPDRVFTLLDRLERHCAEAQPNGVVVVRDLERLGRAVAEHLGEDGQQLMDRASSLTVFSDFPMSLAMLPTDSVPICCRKPIAQRPITPLTRALQLECSHPPAFYLKNGFDVLVAECLDKRDPLHKVASVGWETVRDTIHALPNSQCEIVDVGAVEQLNEHLRRHRFDILILSGHGFYDRERNAAGLMVGGVPH